VERPAEHSAGGRLGDERPRLLLADWPILGFALFLGWQAFNLLGSQAPDQSRHRDRDR
jgi:hypothetical protein